jgi:hypothetical protein
MLRARSFRSVVVAALVALAIATSFSTAVAAPAPAPSRPAAPCPYSGPSIIQQRWIQLGGAQTLGCFVDVQGDAYVFQHGEIEAIPNYSLVATFAAVVGSDHLIHLYWGDTHQFTADYWLVRLSYNDALLNQVRYDPGTGDVAGDYGANVIVHPGNRHGTFEIALEGCNGGGCLGWGSVPVLRLQL